MNEIRELLEQRRKYQLESNAVDEFKILDKITAKYLEIYGKNSDEYISILNEYAGTSKYIGEYQKGIKAIDIAKNIIIEKYGISSIMYATTLLNEIEIYRFMGELTNLENKYLEVINIYEKNNMSSDYEYAGVCNNLGLYYQNIEEYEKALKYHNISYNILKKRLDKKVEYATTLNNMVVPLKKLNRRDEALDNINKSLEIYAKELGKNHSSYASAINNLAIFYLEDKDYEKAYNYFNISLNICKKSFGENSVNYQNIKSNVEFVRNILYKQINKDSSGIEISRKFYIEKIEPIISKYNFKDKVIVGLFGNGSECYRYDDNISKDHDFSPMPIILLKDEYINELDKLKEILSEIDNEYMGYKLYESNIVKERRGVHIYSKYILKMIGYTQNIQENILNIPELCLSEITNGEIFLDTKNIFTKLRSDLKYYNKDIRLHKLANTCYKIYQTAQYNLPRMYERDDKLGYLNILSKSIDNVASLVYILNQEYMPYYKWKMYKLRELSILGEEIYTRLLELTENRDKPIKFIENKIFEIVYILIEEMKKEFNLKTNSLYIYDYINEICDKIENEEIRSLSIWSV